MISMTWMLYIITLRISLHSIALSQSLLWLLLLLKSIRDVAVTLQLSNGVWQLGLKVIIGLETRRREID